MKNKLETFVSKKLIAVVVSCVILYFTGEYQMIRDVVITYLTAQGLVDGVGVWKKNGGKS